MKTRKFRIFAVMVLSIVFAITVTAQSTQFTYQGRLKDGANIANGTYDFEFALYDASSAGTQLGSTIPMNSVAVTEGVFSVQLDFGSQFSGAGRFLEIRVRLSGGGAFNTLTPRQLISSAPYSVKSLSANSADNAVNAANATNAVNATNATNAVTATNFTGNLAGDVTGTQNAATVAHLQGRAVSSTAPAAGQVLKFNGTTNQWTPDTDNTASGSGGGTITGVAAGTGLTGGGTTGNVTLAVANGGIGTTQLTDNGVTDAKINTVSGIKVTGAVANATNAVNATNAATATNAQNAANAALLNSLNSTDFIRNSTNSQASSNFNVSGTGTASILNASTQYNLGGNRILSNPGVANLFVGIDAGVPNPTGQANSFFGSSAGKGNNGFYNSFFGESAGMANGTGGNNSFFGTEAGLKNTAHANSFFGRSSGKETTTGQFNSFFGGEAGDANVTGNNNTAVGNNADVASGNLSYATAIGAMSVVSTNNTIALGRPGGLDTVLIPGNLNVTGTSVSLPANSITDASVSDALTIGPAGTVNDAALPATVVRTSGATMTGPLNLPTDGLTVGGTQLVATQNDRIGIGTANPGGNLHVAFGSSGINLWTSSHRLVLEGSGTTYLNFRTPNNVESGISFSDGVAHFGSIRFNRPVSGNGIEFSTSGGAAMTLNGTGGLSVNSSISAGTQYNIGSDRIIGIPGTNNLYAGIGAGASSSPLGALNNSFFGASAGNANASADDNSFFGSFAGSLNTDGELNTFIGSTAGNTNITGSRNTAVGALADVATIGLTNATAIGYRAQVAQNNSLVLGSINGVNGANADTRVGIGTTTPDKKLHILGAGDQEIMIESSDTGGRRWTLQSSAGSSNGRFEIVDRTPGSVANRFAILDNGNVGVGTTAPDQKLSVNGNASKASGGTSWAVFSDERLKDIQGNFTPGISSLMKLQPIRFQYKPDNPLGLMVEGTSVGFNAQEVEKVLPEAVTRRANGYLQLQSDPILWTMLNSIKEQQSQIDAQSKSIEAQKKQLDQQTEIIRRQQERLNKHEADFELLKKFVCSQRPTAELCRLKG